MGGNNAKETLPRNDDITQPCNTLFEAQLINKATFDYNSIIGRGGFGKVWKVFNKKNRKYYAMKEMSKTKIIDKKSEKSILSERHFLSKMKHPFIVNMHFSFQDNNNLYLVLDLLTGGDLRYHMCNHRHFNEEQAKFILACIIIGLEYCHENSIIHRDIKPENLVFDCNGYVKITDFGIAKIQEGDISKETSGTPGYMAPEVMCALDHTVAVDAFALGIMGYEFMFQRRPYVGKSRKEIKEKIMARQVQIKKDEIPSGWSNEAADCINKLLRRKSWDRLGNDGAKDIKRHPWFNNFQWKDLYHRKLKSPFIPKDEDNFDEKYCNAAEKMSIETIERYQMINKAEKIKYVFNDYKYLNRELENSYNDNPNIKKHYEPPFINPHKEMYQLKQNPLLRGQKSTSELKPLSCSIEGREGQVQVIHQRNFSNDVGASAFLAANMYVNQRHKLKKSASIIDVNCKQTMRITNITSPISTRLISNK